MFLDVVRRDFGKAEREQVYVYEHIYMHVCICHTHTCIRSMRIRTGMERQREKGFPWLVSPAHMDQQEELGLALTPG